MPWGQENSFSDKDIRADKNGLEIKIKQTQHQQENIIKPKRKSKKLCFVAEKLNMSVFLSRSGLKKRKKQIMCRVVKRSTVSSIRKLPLCLVKRNRTVRYCSFLLKISSSRAVL